MINLGKLAALTLLTLAAGGLSTPVHAAVQASAPQQKQWQPGGGHVQIPLWPEGVAIARPEVTGEESMDVYNGPKAPAHRPVTSISNVTRPTMTVFPAKGVNTGAAVLVFPGGGYQILAIDFEGTEVCDWLTPKGITCVVLKYRVPQKWWGPTGQRAPSIQMGLQDAERAMALLRFRAKAFGIDPHNIGVLGFSAGGHLVAQISNADAPNYKPVDAADRQSIRPDFGVALYPGHLWAGREALDLYPFDHISPKAPPTFIVQAEDDPVDDVRNSITYFLALRAAKVPVEMHIYAHGGHAFGLRPSKEPITHWPALVETWLHTIGILRSK